MGTVLMMHGSEKWYYMSGWLVLFGSKTAGDKAAYVPYSSSLVLWRYSIRNTIIVVIAVAIVVVQNQQYWYN